MERDPASENSSLQTLCFNPRAHTGRDQSIHSRQSNRLCFNPRAHTGRDDTAKITFYSISSFNPRAHTGRDNCYFCIFAASIMFQSTRPHRARHVRNAMRSYTASVSIHAPTQGATQLENLRTIKSSSFNPRAHTGRDLKPADEITFAPMVSIHAPTQGATDPMLAMLYIKAVSIHAPTQGATQTIWKF